MSDDAIIIEDHGEWDWSLVVDEDGVHARKPIKHDGVLTFSTAEGMNSSRKRSEYDLSSKQVVDRYVAHADTEMDSVDAIRAVNKAIDKRECGTTECGNCGEEVTPSVSIYRDPRTNRDHRQTTCPQCGERMADGATGRMV